MNKTKIFTFPLERVHCGVPMANGNFGVLLWGEQTLNITVNRSDFWDHRNGELLSPSWSYQRLREYADQHGYGPDLSGLLGEETLQPLSLRPMRLPIGRFEFSFAPGVTPRLAQLNYNAGTVTIELSDGAELTIDLLLRHHELTITDRNKAIKGCQFRSLWEFPRSREFLAERGYCAPELQPMGAIIRPPADLPLEVQARQSGEVWRIFTDKEATFDRQTEIAFTRDWWRQFWWNIPEFSTPEPWIEELFRYQVYRFAAATHPLGYAAGLQGPWHEEYQNAQWGGDYHFNVNVQMLYTPAFALGKAEHLLPLFDMLESPEFQKSLRHNARALFGIEDGLWFTHATDDRGRQCGWLSTGSALDPACGAWMALLYYYYWRYTGDKKFLADRAFPFICGVTKAFAALRDSDGNLPLAISAEYASSNPGTPIAGRNPSYQLAALRKMAAILLELAQVLGREAEPVWRDILEKTPHFTVISGKDRYGARQKEPHIAIWEGQDLDQCHRHHSHLGAIYPFDTLPEPLPEEMAEIIDNSLDHWIGKGFGEWSEWCMMWAVMIYCRSGFTEAPRIMLEMWRQLYVNEGDAVVYLPRSRGIVAHRRHDMVLDKRDHEVMQLDGTGGFISATLEMFVLIKGTEIRLFQGIPAAWRNQVSFRNIHLPDGLTLDYDGKELQLRGPAGRQQRVVIDGKTRELSTS